MINVQKNNIKKPTKIIISVFSHGLAFCENTLSAFFVSDNVQLTGGGNATSVIRNVSEKACLNLCANNRDNRGRSVFCGSSAYDQQKRVCSMYRRVELIFIDYFLIICFLLNIFIYFNINFN
jgi:hypothetical protein